MTLQIKQSVVEEKIDTDEDIELYQNTTFREDIKCRNIISVGEKWNIDARNINAWDIDARNINAGNINAGDIDAWDINAWDIDARNIICETRKLKSEDAKTICRIYIKNKSKIGRKEQEK